MASKFAPKTTFFIKVFSFVFLVPEKRIIFAKVQRRIKSKIRLSYRLSFKLLVVNQSNMLHREIGNGTLNGTQFNGNKRKQLEFVNVISTNQVVSVLYY